VLNYDFTPHRSNKILRYDKKRESRPEKKEVGKRGRNGCGVGLPVKNRLSLEGRRGEDKKNAKSLERKKERYREEISVRRA